MATIRNAFSNSTKTALVAVDATATSITHAANSVAYLAEAGAAHARAYRDATLEDIEANAQDRKLIRTSRNRMENARQLNELKNELDADPDLLEVYAQLESGDKFSLTTGLLVDNEPEDEDEQQKSKQPAQLKTAS